MAGEKRMRRGGGGGEVFLSVQAHERPCEDIARRLPSANLEKSYYQTPHLLAL